MAMSQQQNLYTIVLDYKKHTYVYQLFAKNEDEAQSKWAQEIDLHEIGVPNIKKVKAELVCDAKEEDESPGLLNGLQSVWYASVCTRNLTEPFVSAGANIIATIAKKGNVRNKKQSLQFQFPKNKDLYTVQLDYKSGSYAYQVFANDCVDAKIKWIKEFDFDVVYGMPKDIIQIKEKLLSQSTTQSFIPNPVEGKYSVWSTFLQLGEDIGRITIVATQTSHF